MKIGNIDLGNKPVLLAPMADVTEVCNVAQGDEALIYGDGSGNTLSVAEAANLAGCNKNESVGRLTRRPSGRDQS